MTPEQQAKAFGCSVEQVKALMQRNAADMRRYTDRQLKRAGKTREQMNAIADDYDRRAR